MEQAVIVHFSYGSTDLTRLYALEDQLEQTIASAGVGEFDGHEVAADGSDGSLYIYGPNADRLFETVLPILCSVAFMQGATVRRRYGPANTDAREVMVILSDYRDS